MICLNCSKEFKQKRKDQKFCCTSCTSKYSMRKWRKENPEKNLSSKLKSKFGITLEEYKEMFRKQNGCCACCGKHQLELTKTLNVDHDHSTDIVRGLLCWECNVGIGKLGDNLEGVMKAIKYLENV